MLARSLRLHEPDVIIIALLNDEIRDKESQYNYDQLTKYFSEVIFAKDISIPDFEKWQKRFNVIESSTALKPFFLKYLMSKYKDSNIMYLDPDIYVFKKFFGSLIKATTKSILITPHQIIANTSVPSMIDNELGSLKYGLFNLGFLLIKPSPQSSMFVEWWRKMCDYDCSSNKVGEGIFTDQKWCDLIVCFFDDYQILKDEGLNVASWNLSTRVLRVSPTGEISVNNDSLKFFHFTKVESVGEIMIRRYSTTTVPQELMHWYKKELLEVKSKLYSCKWAYEN
jgi:hypothetical protein